jgi:FAD:protein FMN transferase
MRTLFVFGLAAALSLSGSPSLKRDRLATFQRENVLGTSFEMKVGATTPQIAEQAEAAALAEISRESAILSSWDKQSEFSRWLATRGTAVRVSPELFEVLDLFDSWGARTSGALNPAAEVASQVWKAAAAAGRKPSAAELAGAAAAMRAPHWKLDPSARTATHLDSAPLAMNSFVKSYIMNRAVEAAMQTAGVTAVVLNVGGDLVIRGAWTEPINLADPRSDAENSAPAARLLVKDRAVATSGNYRRGFDIAGRHYSHIIDPRTGGTAEEILSATVISPRPAEAGALATAFCVLSPEESRKVAASVPGTEFLLIARSGQRIVSAGWSQFEAAPSVSPMTFAAKPIPAPAAPAAAGASFDTNFELSVNLELAQLGGGARRPYVAVWIEDKDKFPVRTIALWYQKERWLPDLRSWYRDDRVRAMAEGNDITASVASATRSAGKYSLKWDGKDNAGKLVKAGKYTVCIEAAREHGTYQIMRQEVDFNASPQKLDLPGNQEISNASLDYHKIR